MVALPKLEEVLPASAVVLDVEVADKARAITRAAAELARCGCAPRREIETALLARESLGSTAVGGGIALPHARIRAIEGTHAIFLRLARPIDFDSADSVPADLVCAVVAPDEPSAALLSALSSLARALRDAAKVAVLRKTGNPDIAREVLLGRHSAAR